MERQRSKRARMNTKVFYLLQHLLKCGECGHNFGAKSFWNTSDIRNGKKYFYDLPTPRRYYSCNGMQSLRLRCRKRPNIRAERLEEPIWREVKRVIQNPDLLVAGIDTLDSQESGGLEQEIAQAERDLRSIQTREERAITLFVSGRITEAQLDDQRKLVTERLESVRAKLDEYRARAASGAEKLRLMEAVFTWARDVGQGLDELTPEQRKQILQMIGEEVIVDRDDNVDITLAIPIESEPTTEDSVTVTSLTPSRLGSGQRCRERGGRRHLSPPSPPTEPRPVPGPSASPSLACRAGSRACAGCGERGDGGFRAASTQRLAKPVDKFTKPIHALLHEAGDIAEGHICGTPHSALDQTAFGVVRFRPEPRQADCRDR